METILASFTLSAGLPWLAALATALLFGTFAHSGSYDQAAQIDNLQTQVVVQTLALAAGSTLPAGAITGATDVYLVNTTNGPGTQTTRTAAQIFADLTAQLGFQPPPGFSWVLSLSHSGTGTLTLAGGTGVTISSATAGTATSIATQTGREYICTLVNSTTMTMVNVAILNL